MMHVRKSYIFILVAYCLALLHSTVPHQHASIRPADPKFEARTIDDLSLYELLRSVFSTDLGYGHLEDFAKSDASIDVPQAATEMPVVFLASVYLTEGPHIDAREFFGGFIEKLHTRILLFSSRQFRAPPFVI